MCKTVQSLPVSVSVDKLVVESSSIWLMRPWARRRHGNIVDALIAWQMAWTWLRLRVVHSKETQQSPQSITRFFWTGREATVLGDLPRADGPVGSAQLRVGERKYWDDTAAVFNVLAHVPTYFIQYSIFAFPKTHLMRKAKVVNTV